MQNDENPNPDELLRAVQLQELQNKSGKLKIFFGMSAGVGKTYAMLEEAQQRQRDGVKLVVGTINTHGRKETEAFLQGLPIIPEKWIKYKDTVFEEMDLDAIIDTKPQLVLVDELAHTNVPGAKHPKRWQDVIEILDAGIDVYTTLNVQHVDSRKDLVESLTGIQVHETVPDLILERATSIELIDIPPSELLIRLQEGKIYLGEQSRIAAEHFFQEGNLTALREIALRFTAEKVDHDLHGILQGKGWKTRERLMVAVSSSPSSEQLIRGTRRLAFELDAPWIVVYVDTGVTLMEPDQTRLNRHLNLARDLGAEVITTNDLDIAMALQRIARQKDVTRIIIGRPPKKKLSFWTFFQSSFVDRLENENKHIDIVILRQENPTTLFQRTMPSYQFTSTWGAYGIALAIIAAITAIGFPFSTYVGYKSVGFVFLLGILMLSLFVGRGPILLAALLSAVCWGLLFIPPLFNPSIADPEDITLLIIYFFVAVIMGAFTSRMREQDQFLHKREEKMERLFELERDIANATNLQSLRLNISNRLAKTFPGKFDILTKNLDKQLNLESLLPMDEKDKAAASWAYKSGKVSGWSSDTLPSAVGVYFPIMFATTTVGVLAYQPERNHTLSLEEMNFFQTVAQQLGITLERYVFEEQLSTQDYTRQIERVHKSVFHFFDRSFYNPVKELATINNEIQGKSDKSLHVLTERMDHLISDVKLSVDNIIAISELESGFVHFDKKNTSIKKLVEDSLEEMKPFMKGHQSIIDIPSQPQLLVFDAKLLKQALNNLILNAVEYANCPEPIVIKVEVFEKEFWLSVQDCGPGIPEEIKPLIFDKLYTEPGSSKGLGLGLAIVKAVVDIHQGKIEIKSHGERGTEFYMILPC